MEVVIGEINLKYKYSEIKKALHNAEPFLNDAINKFIDEQLIGQEIFLLEDNICVSEKGYYVASVEHDTMVLV